MNSTHFKGKDAIEHVAEAQADGILANAEIHGTEAPGKITAGADAARDSAIFMLLLWGILSIQPISALQLAGFLTIAGLAFALWKAGRSAWLGWARLERLHRIIAQERWEIEHNRQQEREELRVLYQAKGFEGKLLEEVLDVLMADGNRLLKVMVEEELGLSLAAYDHPLMQCLGAAIGSAAACLLCLAAVALHIPWGMLFGALFVVATAAAISAWQAGNRIIAAIVWNIGLTAISFGSIHFLVQYFF